MDPAPIAKQLAGVLQRFEPPNFGLMQGLVGQVLAACELARVERSVDTGEWATRLIERFNKSGAGPGLHSGIAGMGLVLALYFGGAEELLEAIDAAILPRLAALPPTSMREGWAGIAQYASVRSQSPSGRALQAALVKSFAASSVSERGGTTWHVSRAYAESRGVVVRGEPIRELGMVHGIAGTLTGLAALATAGSAQAAELARGALRWLWAIEQPAPNRFGWSLHGEHFDNLGIGTWCTGDIGVIRGAWLAAQACADGASIARLLQLAREQAQDWFSVSAPARRETNRFDLCCGSTAVAQIFRRFHMETAETVFRTTSDAIFSGNLAACEQVLADDFQFGKLGILTALLSAAANLTPTWDCAFGVSVPQSIAGAM